MFRLSASLPVYAALAFSTAALAQTAQLGEFERAVNVTSDVVTNTTDSIAVVFSDLVVVPNAASIQLRFGRTNIATGCTLRLTSMFDGATQHHSAQSLAQWRNLSAWFNGSVVLVELVAEPNTAPSHVTVASASYLLQLGDDARSICYGTDDRVLSDDPRCGRVFPIGCTAWLIDDANHTLLTAGHCTESAGDYEAIQFNVPLSDSDGSWNHPGPEDQYAVDPASMQRGYSGIGDDWSYFGCFPNTETGLTPFEAQGDSYLLATEPPSVAGQPITIIGYGSTSSPVNPQWNLVQKTHTGPFAYLDGTVIGYTTDTSGGNSGSAVLNDDSGLAIGIHTNAGCSSGGGYNHGCAINNAGLQNALANPQGVCIPNIMYLRFPDGQPESMLPGLPLDVVFEVEAGDESPTTVSLVLRVDGSTTTLTATPLGSNLYNATIPPQVCDANVDFYLEAIGDGGTTVTLPISAPANQYTLFIGELETATVLAEAFDEGLPTGWSATGLWHAADSSCASANDCDGGGVMYFGLDTECSYGTGNLETGTLSTPPISLDGIAGDLILTYCSNLSTEGSSTWDLATVQVNGVDVEQAPDTSGWEERTVNLGSFTDDTVVVSFHFDTVDEQYNEYAGWHIDGVHIEASAVNCDDAPACVGDVDGSGDVGATDLLIVIADWGQTGSVADVNDDGVVDASDLLAVIGGWGPC